MTDDAKPTNSITLNLGDPKVWAVIVTIVGGQFAANKLSLSGVETQQERVADTAKEAVQKQDSIDDKLGKLQSAQDQFQGEMRYRLEQVETRMRELPKTIEAKGGR